MTEFWESSFRDKKAMWGFAPSDSAVSTAAFFSKNSLKEILIPGFGYGRNAEVFAGYGLHVTGIEISETAIEIARRHYGDSIKVYHGSVSEMPYDSNKYDGIFCYALIHLLDEQERAKLIKDCFAQLEDNGWMVFVALSKSTSTFKQGVKISQDRYQSKHGVNLFFYDMESVKKEFGDYGMVEAREVTEPSNKTADQSFQVFWQITCSKRNTAK